MTRPTPPELLLDAKAEANSPNWHGIGPLHAACGLGFPRIARVLVERKAQASRGLDPWHYRPARRMRAVSGAPSFHMRDD